MIINFNPNLPNLKITTNPNQNPYKTFKNSFYPQKIFNEDEEKVFAIQFVSGDQNIHYPIACKESDIFLNIEKKFLDIYPFLRNKNSYYIAN